MQKFLEFISVYKRILFFIVGIIAIESILFCEEYFYSWFSLYICFMLFVVDINKTLSKKIITSLFCFAFLVSFSWLIYYIYGENHKDIHQLFYLDKDTVLSFLDKDIVLSFLDKDIVLSLLDKYKVLPLLDKDTALSLLLPFVFYFIDYYCMKSKIKEIQEYEDKRNKEKKQ